MAMSSADARGAPSARSCPLGPVYARTMTSGAEPLGRWSDTAGSSLTFPELGTRYRVTREFTDHDGDVHPAGEEWTYLGTSFLPYHSGRSFFISFDDRQEWMLPMQDLPEAQGGVLSEFETYITAIGPSTVGQQVRQKIEQVIAREIASRAEAARRAEQADINWARVLPWLFIVFGPFGLMTLYYELSRKLDVPATGDAELVALGVCVLAGAFAVWWKTRPSMLWPVLYIPVATLFVVILIAASISPH
jgi:Domain of unknown function (DUF3601)